MSIPDFNSDTFAAFTDISGFKVMMVDGKRAVKALDRFYSIGYDCLQQTRVIHGLFLSDCGVLFSCEEHKQTRNKLKPLLSVIERINRQLLEHDIMLTTSHSFWPVLVSSATRVPRD